MRYLLLYDSHLTSEKNDSEAPILDLPDSIKFKRIKSTQQLRCMGTPQSLSTIFAKGNNVCDFPGQLKPFKMEPTLK